MKIKKTWVVVANSNLARIFRLETIKDLVELEAFEHPESRLPGRELVGDKQGRGFESAYSARHAKVPKTSPRRLEFSLFAKHLADHLENARKGGEFEVLYIAANPAFLGLLRQTLTDLTLQLLKGEVDKDLTQMKPEEIRSHFFSS